MEVCLEGKTMHRCTGRLFNHDRIFFGLWIWDGRGVIDSAWELAGKHDIAIMCNFWLLVLVLVPVLVIGIGIGYPLWFYPVL